MIDLQQVTKTYSKSDKKAVDNLTLNVKGGELFGFIGPNGAGKTTTIKMMTGVLTPDEGTITMAGHRMDTERLEAQRMIGFVPDGNDLYDRLTGMEYLNFMADIYQVDQAKRKAHIEKYLDLFSLSDAINNQVRTYSKGMKQKLVVIGALIHNPPVWILDEPLGLQALGSQVVPRHGDFSIVGFQNAGHHFDGGGFARAVGADEAEQLPALYLQRQVVHGFEAVLGVGLRNTLQIDHVFSHTNIPPCRM